MSRPKCFMRSLLTMLVIVAVLSGACATAATPTSNSIAIKNVSVFDSAGERMLPGQTIVIEGDRIKEVGTAIPVPLGAEIIEGEGQFVIPGLMDAHVHLVHLADRTHVLGEEFLPLFLAAGVTSVRSTGDLVEAEKRILKYSDEHSELCPRVFMASPLIDGDPPTHKDVGYVLTKADQVAPFVQEMQRAGVTTLKIYVGTSREVGQQVIAEGHRHGLVITGHLGRYAAQDAVADGIDCLEHIWSVLDYIVPRGETRCNCNLNNALALKLIGEIKAQDVAVDPTLVVFRNMILLGDQQEFIQHPDNSLVPDRMKRGWHNLLQERQFPPESPELRRQEFRKYQELTGVLYRSGVTLLAGTDAPEPLVCPGYSMHQELELLVESGLPSGAALNCATINVARILKRENDLGSVEVGKLADFVLLRLDPLKDIHNTRSITKVIRGGRVFDPNEILHAVPAK